MKDNSADPDVKLSFDNDTSTGLEEYLHLNHASIVPRFLGLVNPY